MSSQRGTKRTSSSTSCETTTSPDPKRKKVKSTRFSSGPKTKWTAAQVYLLLDNLFSYIQKYGMPHSVSKKSIRPKIESEDEEEEDEDGEVKENVKEKMTAGDKAWEIIAKGTQHMNRGAYDKWANLKDKVQPSLIDKAFEHVKKELINVAEKTVKEEKPELKGDAY